MTTIFLITAGAFLLIISIMSVGVIFAKKPIQGSCGGLSALSDVVGQPLCEVCGGDPAKRPPGCGEPLPDEFFESTDAKLAAQNAKARTANSPISGD